MSPTDRPHRLVLTKSQGAKAKLKLNAYYGLQKSELGG